jgi:DNA polymerase elongation subunit (family B)
MATDHKMQINNAHKLHGTVIHYTGKRSLSDISRPVDPDLRDAVDYAIKKTSASFTETKANSPSNGVVRELKNMGGDRILFKPITYKEINERIDNVSKYELLVHGILPDGRKTAVIVEGVRPYFYIKTPKDVNPHTFGPKIYKTIKEIASDVKTSTVLSRGFKCYEKHESVYHKFSFNTIWSRKRAIEYINTVLEDKKYELATDDRNHFERVVFRDNPQYSSAGWNVINGYRSYKTEEVSKTDKTFRVRMNNLVAFDGDVTDYKHLAHDRSVVGAWDIETFTESGELPDADRDGDVVFMIGQTYHMKTDAESFLDVCFTACPCAPRNDKLTVVCKSEKMCIRAAFELFGLISPEYIVGFNDGDYDWPFVLNKALRYNLVGVIKASLSMYNDWRDRKGTSSSRTESIIKWDCRKLPVKVDADTKAYSTTMTTPGSINVDIRTVLRKKHKTEKKSSLKFYLSLYKLGGKEDMPIHVLFQIYKEYKQIKLAKSLFDKQGADYPDKLAALIASNKERMADVAHYCVIDSKKCQELQVRISAIADYEEISSGSHTSPYDCFFFADMMKVSNLVMAEGQQQGLLFHTRVRIDDSKVKYPGAYVFPPEKGIVAPKHSLRERKIHDPKWSAVPMEDIKLMESTILEEWKGLREEYYEYNLKYSPIDDIINACEKVRKFSHKNVKGLLESYLRERIDTGLDFQSLAISIKQTRESNSRWGIVSDDDLLTIEIAIGEVWDDRKSREPPPAYKGVDDIVSETKGFTSALSKQLFREFLEEEGDYPVSGLDFSSLYPSIIMTYNLSPERMVFKQEDADALVEDGHAVHAIDFVCAGVREQAWSIRHDTIDGKTLQEGKTEAKVGLYPFILQKLFNERSVIKKKMKVFGHKIEILKQKGQQDTPEFISYKLKYNDLNSKQGARKVFMNTFYGMTGNRNHPFFVLAIAGGITSEGRRNIKMVAQIVKDAGCRLKYGDTDSCYISCPVKHFTDIDRKYFGGTMTKEEYATALVNMTFKQIDVMKQYVNKLLIKDNGTTFLRVAYEEVLYPCMFLLRKMYAGVEHEELVNFHPRLDEVFTRGLSIKRRSSSELLKIVCGEVLMESLNLDNLDDMITIIKRKIIEIYKRKWDLEDFKKSAAYKPTKNNVSVQTFKARMETRGDPMCPPPLPNERFDYVVTKKYPFIYDEKGLKSVIKVGDKMEYYTYAKTHDIEIDLDYYMTGGVIGQFAQFLSRDFEVQATGDSKSEQDVAQKMTLKAATSFIKTLCKQHGLAPVCKGPVLKKIYSIANTTYSGRLKSAYGGAESSTEKIKLLNSKINATSTETLFSSIKAIVDVASTKSSGNYAECYISYMRKKYGKGIVFIIKKVSTGKETQLMKKRRVYVNRVITKTREEFRANMPALKKMFDTRDASISFMSDRMKKVLKLGDEKTDISGINAKTLGESDVVKDILNDNHDVNIQCVTETLNLFHRLYTRLLSAATHLQNTVAIVERADYYAGIDMRSKPTPPGIKLEDEGAKALDFIRNNVLNF